MIVEQQIDFRVIFSGYDSFEEWAWPRKREAEASISETSVSIEGQSGSFGASDSSECASSKAFSTLTGFPAASSIMTSRIAMWWACIGNMKFFTKSISFIHRLLFDRLSKASDESVQKGKRHD